MDDAEERPVNPYDNDDEHTPDPTSEPTLEPTAGPTADPTADPTPDPTPDPMPWWSSAPSSPSSPAATWTPEPAAATEPAEQTPAEPAAPKRRRPWLRQTGAVVAAVVISAAATGAVVHTIDDSNHGNASATPTASSTSVADLPSASQVSSSVKSALAKIEPSVVIINDTVTTSGNGRGGFGGFGGFQADGAGTGIIISADGEVVTNAHVVNGATNIKVTLPNNGGTHDATVVGMDTGKDLAVIKVSGVSGLTAATFADSDTVQVGDSVIAVGNALGYGGSPTVTEGIVSAKDRSLQDSEDNLSGLLQTDAAINPGNSGGPLVDTNGDVVGINVAVATGTSSEPAQNIGFSIPSNTVVKALPDLKAGKSSGGATQSTTYLGVQIADAQDGAGIVAVQPGSPADKAGLKANDIITKFDDTTISDSADLQRAVRAQKPGDTATLTVIRDGQTMTVKVTLGSNALNS
jgi:putative serine protease PepD